MSQCETFKTNHNITSLEKILSLQIKPKVVSNLNC